MKLNKKNKGKVHPSPSPSSSATPGPKNEATTALNLLPAAILAIIAVLSLQDREVLAYMVTRSIKAAANPAVLLEENLRRRSKNPAVVAHKSPLFDCGCFDCYTSYWFRWDSSPNRELIHQAIEALEEHFVSGDQSKTSARGKRREKTSGGNNESEMLSNLAILERFLLVDGNGRDLKKSPPPESVEIPVQDPVPEETRETEDHLVESSPEEEKDEAVARTAVGGRNHKGLARKVLPDVIGLFNSRLWSLWSPNV